MKTTFFTLLLVCSLFTKAQVFISSSCTVSFFSATSMENIDGTNNKSKAVANLGTGSVAIKLVNMQFQFKSAFMQEHFNENYMESEKYPYSSFTGKIQDSIDLKKPGVYTVNVKGTLSMHGVDQERTIPATLTIVNAESVKVESKFKIKIADHKIKVPSLVGQNIAESVDVMFNADFIPFKK